MPTLDLQNPVIIFFLTINVIAFIVIANDKRKARVGDDYNRTPEGFIYFLATCFAAIGVYLAMFVFRHKTLKWYFKLGIPLLIIQNIATVYVINSLVALW